MLSFRIRSGYSVLVGVASPFKKDVSVPDGPGASQKHQRGHVHVLQWEFVQRPHPFPLGRAPRVLHVGAEGFPPALVPEDAQGLLQQMAAFASGGVVKDHGQRRSGALLQVGTDFLRRDQQVGQAEQAEAVLEGMKNAGAEAVLLEPAQVDASTFSGVDAVAFGCPAMGSEVLEEMEFEPMFSACKNSLGGKKVALFGSFGWGDGEWMRTWEKDCDDAGINLACDSITCQETPDDDTLEACRAMGKQLAE